MQHYSPNQVLDIDPNEAQGDATPIHWSPLLRRGDFPTDTSSNESDGNMCEPQALADVFQDLRDLQGDGGTESEDIEQHAATRES